MKKFMYFNIQLGKNKKFVTPLCAENGETGVEIWQWEERCGALVKTDRGVRLSLSRFKLLMECAEEIDNALNELKAGNEAVDFSRHLGGNLYVTVSKYHCVNLRFWYHPNPGEGALAKDLRPTKGGIAFVDSYQGGYEWSKLKDVFKETLFLLPEINDTIPCCDSSDHSNQMGALMCGECNPNTYRHYIENV